MPTPQRKKMTQRALDALETKNTLHSTALMLFTKRGYDKVTIDDITRYASVSKGTFYNHFDSKDAVLVEQFHKIDDHYEQVFKRIDPNESAIGRLQVLFSAMCEFCSVVCGVDTMRVVYINQISQGRKPTILTNRSRPFYTLLTTIIELGQQNGEFTKHIPVNEQVDMLAQGARSILYEWCLHDGSYDLNAAGHRVVQFFYNYVRYVESSPDKAFDLI